jgi:hypothetical protein
VRAIAHRRGGSAAQCDVVHLTLTEAALRAQHIGLARALVPRTRSSHHIAACTVANFGIGTLAAERNAQKPDSGLDRQLARRVRTMAAA